ncbi:MAG: hypothetical protein Q9174_004236 [Haloplaca sp. 1 TL-2023]
MRLFCPLILVFGVVSIHAELHCLLWGVVLGSICHFKPQAFESAQNTVAAGAESVKDSSISAVEGAVESVKDLVKFDLTHNPAYIAYDFIATTKQDGLAAGGQTVEQAVKDFVPVTIGFGKEAYNQVEQLEEVAKIVAPVQVLTLEVWNDVSLCIIKGAAALARSEKPGSGNFTSRKRATEPAQNGALTMAQECLQPSKPWRFNITDPKEKVGATISDIAPMLVPFGGEAEAAVAGGEAVAASGYAVAAGEEAGAQAADQFVLAIPGSEASSSVMAWSGDDLVGQTFKNADEATAVRENLKDEAWAKENCRICGPAAPSTVSTTRRTRRRRSSRLNRRGNVMGTCCRVPQTLEPFEAKLDVGPEEYEARARKRLGKTHNPRNYNFITETELVPPIEFKPRDINTYQGVTNLQNDLNSYSTAVVPWTPELSAAVSEIPEGVFPFMRKVFTSPDDPLHKAMKISPRDNGLRLTSWSELWLRDPDPALAPLQKFVQEAVEQGKATAASLKAQNKLTDEEIARLDGSLEFLYTPPSEVALTGTDPRGFHIDHGLMSLAAADTPGLIIRSFGTETASRLLVEPESFYLMKALTWDQEGFLASGRTGPTWHSVFGPEMAEKGRVSMVMTIFIKAVEDAA